MLDGEHIIVQRAVQGESSAFGLLYDHYQPHIYRFVFIKVSRREEAEDLTHQVFLNAWTTIRNYTDFGFPFSSWLYRIARNEVIDYYRRKRETVGIDEIDPEQFAVASIAPDLVDHQLKMKQVLGVLRSIKPDYQDVIIMRYVEELSPKEIAKALDKSEGAVKLMQHRAIRELRKLLDDHHESSRIS